MNLTLRSPPTGGSRTPALAQLRRRIRTHMAVFIRRAGESESFGECPLSEDDTVARLLERAAAKFSWAIPSTQLRLYSLTPAQARAIERGAPTADIVDGEALFSGDVLATLGIAKGAFLLAHLQLPPAFAHDSSGIRSLPEALQLSPAPRAPLLGCAPTYSGGIVLSPRLDSISPLKPAASEPPPGASAAQFYEALARLPSPPHYFKPRTNSPEAQLSPLATSLASSRTRNLFAATEAPPTAPLLQRVNAQAMETYAEAARTAASISKRFSRPHLPSPVVPLSEPRLSPPVAALAAAAAAAAPLSASLAAVPTSLPTGQDRGTARFQEFPSFSDSSLASAAASATASSPSPVTSSPAAVAGTPRGTLGSSASPALPPQQPQPQQRQPPQQQQLVPLLLAPPTAAQPSAAFPSTTMPSKPIPSAALPQPPEPLQFVPSPSPSSMSTTSAAPASAPSNQPAPSSTPTAAAAVSPAASSSQPILKPPEPIPAPSTSPTPKLANLVLEAWTGQPPPVATAKPSLASLAGAAGAPRWASALGALAKAQASGADVKQEESWQQASSSSSSSAEPTETSLGPMDSSSKAAEAPAAAESSSSRSSGGSAPALEVVAAAAVDGGSVEALPFLHIPSTPLLPPPPTEAAATPAVNAETPGPDGSGSGSGAFASLVLEAWTGKAAEPKKSLAAMAGAAGAPRWALALSKLPAAGTGAVEGEAAPVPVLSGASEGGVGREEEREPTTPEPTLPPQPQATPPLPSSLPPQPPPPPPQALSPPLPLPAATMPPPPPPPPPQGQPSVLPRPGPGPPRLPPPPPPPPPPAPQARNSSPMGGPPWPGPPMPPPPPPPPSSISSP